MVSDRYLGVILAFNVRVPEEAAEDAKARGVRVFSSDVIYNLVDDYTNWVSAEKDNEQRATLSTMTPPCKLRLLRGLVFHRSGPAVFGVEILEGTLRQGEGHEPDGRRGGGRGAGAGRQQPGRIGEEGRASLCFDERTRHRAADKEEETLYSLPSSDDARLYKTRFADRLSADEIRLLDSIISMRRKVQ